MVTHLLAPQTHTGSIPVALSKRGRMFQGGDGSLQELCGEFDSHRLHQLHMHRSSPTAETPDLRSGQCGFESLLRYQREYSPTAEAGALEASQCRFESYYSYQSWIGSSLAERLVEAQSVGGLIPPLSTMCPYPSGGL